MNDRSGEGRLHRKLERANAYLARGDLVAARAAYEAILQAEPGFPPAAIPLLRVAEKQGRFRQAHALAIDLLPMAGADVEAILRVAQGLARHGESLDAIGLIERVRPDDCHDPELLQELAQLAILLDETEIARRMLDRLAALQPDSAPVMYQQGVLDVFAGKLEAAEAAFERCLQRAPGFGQAHWSLSRLRRQPVQANHLDRLRNALPRASMQDAPSLAFALFKELDDLGDYKEAWSALALGCRLKRASLRYDPAEDRAGFEALARLHQGGHFSPRQALDAEWSGPRPIFIVGLPRSGTTVLEQLLATHPDIRAAGELPDFAMQMRWVGNRYSRSYLDAGLIDAVGSADSGELGQHYLQHTQWRARGRSYYIDKMPLNFANVGFILQSIPGAMVIHMRKSPMDACFSNLKELFTRMYPHTYQLDELADYHGQYSSLMARWRSMEQAATRLLEVDYQALVTEPEATLRSLLDTLGLAWSEDWSSAVVRGATVTTASAAQVREPLHSRALGQWKNYAEWLGPLIDTLA